MEKEIGGKYCVACPIDNRCDFQHIFPIDINMTLLIYLFVYKLIVKHKYLFNSHLIWNISELMNVFFEINFF